MNPDTSQSNLSQNMSGSLFEMYSAMFGNINFAVAPSMTGEVSNRFGTLPYLALESVIYAQASNAQQSPVNLLSGQNSGQQNIQGQYTIQDANGLTRMVMGYSPNGF